METFRKILNGFFWFVFSAGLIALIILLIGGAFSFNLNVAKESVPFDIANFTWKPLNASNSELEIVFEEDEKHDGWGAMKYTYIPEDDRESGFYSETYSVSGFLIISFWVKSEKKALWQMRLQRKSDEKVFKYNFRTGPEWKQYQITHGDLRKHTGYKGKYSNNDFKQWMKFVDISKVQDEKNTLWIDTLIIQR